MLVVEYSNAQEIVLNKYKFGEGLGFSGKDNNYKMEIINVAPLPSPQGNNPLPQSHGGFNREIKKWKN